MATIETQHCDLTEIYNNYTLYHSRYDAQNGCYVDEKNPNALINVKTEFAFATVSFASRQEHTVTALKDLGFIPITTMNNWWYSHYSEWRPITFYWKRMKSIEESVEIPYNTKYWYSVSDNASFMKPNPVQTIHASGCGFSLNFNRFSSKYWRYFTLFRAPLKLTPGKQNWLKQRNFRLLDTGKFAQYYINGWDTDKYTKELEQDYWKGVGVSLDAREPVKFDHAKVNEWRAKNGY